MYDVSLENYILELESELFLQKKCYETKVRYALVSALVHIKFVKKQGIIEKLIKFFEKYLGLV